MRVSVATAQKPAPKATFKYLRRDEGRLSYSASSPMRSSSATTTPTTGSKVAPRRDSQALRDAIATDMRQGRSHDPLGEVIVALPKRAPPPSSEGAVGESAAIGSSSSVEDGGPRRSSSAAAPASTTAKTPRRGGTPTATRRRPEWVDPVVYPNQGEPAPLGRPVRRSPSGGNVHHEDMTGGRGPSNGREEHSFDATPHGAHNDASASAQIARRPSSAPRRYGQGATSFEEDYRQRERQPSTNFFGRPTTREYRRPSHGVEDELLLQLQEEVEAAQEERSRYTRYKQQLERERQRFEDYKHEALLKLDEERADLEAYRVSEHRSAQQDIHSMEDRYRKVSALLATERENSRHVMAEADGLRAQLDNLTRAMREAQFNHKSEVQRLRRDVESLSRRNAELLTMAKEQQMGALGSAAAAADSASTRSSKPRGAYLDDSPSASRQRVAAPTTSPPREAVVEESPSNPRSANSRRETSMPNLSDMSSQKGGAADGSEAGEVKEQSGVLEAKPYHSMIIDFTPLSTTSEHAKEKRAKQMEERMKREDAAMQQRRQQRERETMERREKEVAEQAQREAEERQRREEQAAAAPKSSTKKEKTAATPTNTNGSSVSRKRSDDKAEEVSNERKSSGHPVRTPRVGGSAKSPKKAAAGKKTSSSATTSTTSPAALPSRPSVHIPTREELIGCTEGIPEETYPNDAVVSQTAIGDNPNKREELYRSGKREIHYANGTVKAVLPSGHTVLHFTNGDVKCTFPSGKSTYWYAAAKTTHSQLPDGVQVFEFHTTGQTERHFSDGVKHILYPDGLFKVHHADGTDETFLPENHTSNTNGA